MGEGRIRVRRHVPCSLLVCCASHLEVGVGGDVRVVGLVHGELGLELHLDREPLRLDLRMVKRSEMATSGGVWLTSHRLLRWSEAPALSSRVRRAASSLRMRPHEPALSRSGTAKTATLTTLLDLEELQRRRDLPDEDRGR